MRTNKLSIKNTLTKLIALFLLTISLLSISTICNGASSKTNTQSKTYEYYGIVEGNSQQCNIYLKVADTWQVYTAKNNYKGYECKLIVLDRELTESNYKKVKILGTKEAKDQTKAQECITDYMIALIFDNFSNKNDFTYKEEL